MKTFGQHWAGVAGDLLAQALAGEPQFVEAPLEPFRGGSFGFDATLAGDEQGRFSIVLDGSILETPLMGEGVDQKAGWTELLQETINAACGEHLAKTGRKCRLTRFEPSIDAIDPESQIARTYQLRAGDRSWTVFVEDDIRVASGTQPGAAASQGANAPGTGPGAGSGIGSGNGPGNGPGSNGPENASGIGSGIGSGSGSGTGPGGEMGSKSGQKQNSSQFPGQTPAASPGQSPGLTPGLDLLLDVELEATLRFGSREMQLGEVLELGPGDVVQLDRYITDTVDLLVGDKIVARGDVVLVNGNFGLRVTEVAQPRKRLESIRCLF